MILSITKATTINPTRLRICATCMEMIVSREKRPRTIPVTIPANKMDCPLLESPFPSIPPMETRIPINSAISFPWKISLIEDMIMSCPWMKMDGWWEEDTRPLIIRGKCRKYDTVL